MSRACTAADGGSGIALADQSFNLTTNVSAGTETADAQTGSKALTDAVGNSTTAGPLGNNKVDKKAPTFSCAGAAAGWSDSDVSRACTAADGGSGIPGADESFNLTTNVAGGTETADAQTGSKLLTDGVGNSSTAGPLGNNKVDKKAPVVICDTADGVWHPSDALVHCTASDGGSGIALADQSFNLTTNVPAGTEDANASTGSRDVTDGVNHTTTAGPIAGNKVDKKAPVVSCDTADGAWHANDASVHCTATDGGSGIALADQSFNLTTNVPAGTEEANASTGTHDVTDGVGHTTTAGPIAGNKVDKKAPVITCPVTAPVFLLNQSPANVVGSFTDGGSGPASGSSSTAANTSCSVPL